MPGWAREGWVWWDARLRPGRQITADICAHNELRNDGGRPRKRPDDCAANLSTAAQYSSRVNSIIDIRTKLISAILRNKSSLQSSVDCHGKLKEFSVHLGFDRIYILGSSKNIFGTNNCFASWAPTRPLCSSQFCRKPRPQNRGTAVFKDDKHCGQTGVESRQPEQRYYWLHLHISVATKHTHSPELLTWHTHQYHILLPFSFTKSKNTNIFCLIFNWLQ